MVNAMTNVTNTQTGKGRAITHKSGRTRNPHTSPAMTEAGRVLGIFGAWYYALSFSAIWTAFRAAPFSS